MKKLKGIENLRAKIEKTIFLLILTGMVANVFNLLYMLYNKIF